MSVYKAQDFTGDIEEQVTGSCMIPAGAIVTALLLVVFRFFSGGIFIF